MADTLGRTRPVGPETWPAAALLDALPDATAVLDGRGTVVAVNRAWRMFALDNGADPDRTGVGASYLQECARAAAAGCQDAATVLAGLGAVLDGATIEYDLEYACAAPAFSRWFTVRITRIAGPEPGALVSHLNISRQKLAEATLRQQATADPLTELANRTLLHERLATALSPRPGRSPAPDVGLVYVDLDDFKPVNDTFGHAAGDGVLQTVASRLRQATRPQDTVARLGGDEFVVLASRITGTGLVGLADRIGATLTRTHLIHGQELAIGFSLGTCLAGPADTADEALERADAAMFAVKEAHRADRCAAALPGRCPARTATAH